MPHPTNKEIETLEYSDSGMMESLQYNHQCAVQFFNTPEDQRVTLAPFQSQWRSQSTALIVTEFTKG